MFETKALREDAHRQAGRAVVCVVQYGPNVVKDASIVPHRDAIGAVTTFSNLPIPISARPPVEPTTRRGKRPPIEPSSLIDAQGICAYSGIAAEYLFSCDQRAGARDADPAPLLEVYRHRESAVEEREELARLAATLGAERPAGDFFDAYWDEAIRLLRAHWTCVSKLAEALLEHHTLGGDRVDAIVLGQIV